MENKEIQAFAGINNEYVPFGNFIIQKPDNKEVKEKTNFIGYDYMIKFNVPYKNRVTHPIKAGLLFKDVCEQVGLEAGNTSFINSEYMILGNPFTNNEDCRTVLSNLAQLAGGFAKIGRDNKVYIKTLKNISNLLTAKYVNEMTVKEFNLTMVKALSAERDNADEEIDGNNYFTDFSKNEQWGELNSLVLRISGTEGENTTLQDNESITNNGLTELTIEDNYFLINQVEREKVITPIWNTLKGIKYLPFKTNYYGYPYLDCGDIIYIQDTKDIGYISYVLNHTFKFNGAFSGTLDTPAMTRTQTAYKNTFDLKTKFKNAERKIDKINGIIEDIIEEQTETSQKLTQHEQTIDGITDTVSNIETKVETVESSTIYKVDVMYALSSSATQKPTTGWQKQAPSWQQGKYMWQKTVTTYGDGTIKETSATCISGAKGADGQNGINGTNGQDGQDGQDGANGIGVQALEEQYYLSTSNTTQTGGSWKSTQDTWINNKYVWTRNKITWTDGTTTYTTPVLATGINKANEVANTAKNTADSVNSNLTTNYYTKTQTNAQIETKADSITQSVSKTYSTKTETANAKQEAINSANASTDEKLEDYSTTSEMNSAITQKANEIMSILNDIEDVTNTVEGIKTIALGNCTKGELLELHIYGNNTVFDYLYPSNDLYPSNNLYPYGDSRITINSEVHELGVTEVLRQNGEVRDEFVLLDGKAKVIRRINKDGTVKATETTEELGELKIPLQEGTNTITIKNYTARLKARFAIKNEYTEVFATRVEMNSSITQTANEIKSEVKKKVDEDEVCSTISQSAEEILLKGNRVLIDSDNFKLEKNGNMTCSNATLTKGTLKFYDTHGKWVATQSVAYVGNIGQEALHLQILESNTPSFLVSFENNPLPLIKASRISTNELANMSTSSGYTGVIEIGSAAKLSNLLVNTIQPSQSTSPQINFTSDIYTPKRVLGSEFVNVSEKKLKENIYKLKGNSKNKTVTRKATDIIKNTDICEYNFKGTKHKQIGVIIGENYNTPDEILSEDKKGVDLYSMISVLYKAFQEQNEEMQSLKERLDKYEQ